MAGPVPATEQMPSRLTMLAPVIPFALLWPVRMSTSSASVELTFAPDSATAERVRKLADVRAQQPSARSAAASKSQPVMSLQRLYSRAPLHTSTLTQP